MVMAWLLSWLKILKLISTQTRLPDGGQVFADSRRKLFYQFFLKS
jgi:hypothetical protein